MTNILALPELTIPCTIRTNEDWTDSVAFFDVNGNPVALDGIAFEAQARESAASGDVLLNPTTANGQLQLCSAGALVQPLTPGEGYAVGDTIAPAGGAGVVTPATLTVTALALVQLAATVVGTGHNPGDVLTLAGGVFSTPAQVTIDQVGANGVPTVWHLSAPGSYTVVPATLAIGSTTGTGSGTTFGSLVWGVAAARMTAAGTYEAVPTNPVAQASTSGLGAGATFAFEWVNNALCFAVPEAAITDYLLLAATVLEVRAEADGYTVVVITGPLTVIQGIVR